MLTPDPLPPFSGQEARCPKCRSTISSEHQQAGTVFIRSLSGGRFMWGFERGADEWLLRECDGCGYSWPEACADSHVDTMFGESP